MRGWEGGEGCWRLFVFGDRVWVCWDRVLLFYSWVCGSLCMWGKDSGCLGWGLLGVWQGSRVFESQHDHVLGM